LIKPRPSCSTCISFREMKGPREAGEEKLGECWYKPPKILIDSEFGAPVCLRPLVSEDEYCVKGYRPQKEYEEEDLHESQGKTLDNPSRARYTRSGIET